MAKIKMKVSVSMAETFGDFLLAKKSLGLSEKTLRTYKEHLSSIRKHLPIDNSMDSIEQKDLERMISSMRDVGLSANSIQSYTRTLKSFSLGAKKKELQISACQDKRLNLCLYFEEHKTKKQGADFLLPVLFNNELRYDYRIITVEPSLETIFSLTPISCIHFFASGVRRLPLRLFHIHDGVGHRQISGDTAS